MMRLWAFFASEEADNQAILAPPRRVCPTHEHTAVFALHETAKQAFSQVFLDTEWLFASPISPGMMTTCRADGGTVRAFFYSKHHARCLNEDRAWWRCVGHFI
jgi:hypothetical protein